MGKLYTGSVGTLIRLETGINLTGATKTTIQAIAPTGGAATELTASVDGTKLVHTKTATTLASAGTWTLQSYVEFDSGATKHYGDSVKLDVYAAGD